MIKSALPETRSARLRQFRTRNMRIDYYPTADARAVIKQLRALNPKLSIVTLLDALVVAGQEALAGRSK